jgi:N-acetylglutamate synthase-like GNAT family acetyltransferase
MPDIKLRKALASDIPEMYRIDVDGWHQNFIDLERGVTSDVLKNKYGKVHGDLNRIKKFGETVLSDQQVSFVAEVEGKVVGWINLENLYTPDISWLNIYIDKSWQGKGIGGLLMEQIIKDYSHIEMHIATPEKAGSKGFFKKFGFVEYPVTGRKEGPGNLYMIQMKRSSA